MKNYLPSHIAIIMDGNRRWAKAHNKRAIEGHRKGVDTLMVIVKAAGAIGIKYLTVYALSSENYETRSKEEIGGLLNLINYGIKEYLPRLKKEGVRVNFLGDIQGLPVATRLVVGRIRRYLSSNKRLVLNIAINYGSRKEILRAAEALAKKGKEFNQENFEKELYTADIPDPDLVIRTGGQKRVSNFLLWQISYSEFYFSDILWPDFNKKELDKALLDYSVRKRNFGR